MTAMVGSQAVIPHGHPFTVTDLEATPEDGNRYELIDGILLVGPAPIRAHQEMGAAACVEPRSACHRALRVVLAPFALRTPRPSRSR